MTFSQLNLPRVSLYIKRKMSESQDVQSTESKENSDSECSRPRSIVDDKKESSFDGYETPKSECTTTSKSDEPEKNVGNVDTNLAKPPTNLTSGMNDQQHQQIHSGECNLLPVLVERLRSALELSSQSSEDQLPIEDSSGVDSEEDLRNWALGLNNFIDQNETTNNLKLDLKFLEDLLLSDIQTALARLQDTLKRVDIGVLTKYNSTLDPTNKLHLLRLISNLLAKLKIPEDAIKPENKEEKSLISRRNRSERHTIGVSSEELAQARKWFDERNPQGEFDFKNLIKNEKLEIEEKFPTNKKVIEISSKIIDNEDKNNLEKQFNQVHEKYMKDAINQQQSLQNKNREPKEDNFDRILENDDSYSDNITIPFYQQPSAPKYNKFLAKKSRLKRANTIDIPNYLKIQSDQNGLRKPIDISDKILSNGGNVIPSFQPKTENDRKFLALINKNNDNVSPMTSVPFKNFNHRQNSIADKNWTNRFSNIKTAFDKQNNHEIDEKIDNKRKSIDNNEFSLKLSYGPTKKSNGFTHAPTSPFQKIEKISKIDPPAFLKPGYNHKNNLQAKVKIFDQEQNSKTPPPPPRTKLIKTNIFHDDINNENGHINYQTFCKQFAPKGSNHLNQTRSKFINDDIKIITKESIKKLPFVTHENGPFQKSKQKLLKMQQNNESQNYYPKQYEIYPVNVNSSIANIGYRYDHHSEQKTRNSKNFEKINDKQKCAKFSNESDHSSIGVQTGVDNYQDKNRFLNLETRKKSNNASVQTSELCNINKNFDYQNSFANCEIKNKFEDFKPLATELDNTNSSKITKENSRIPPYIGLLEISRPYEQTGPPVPERSNYNNVLLRNYKSDQIRSKSSYYDYEENPTYVPSISIRRNSLDKNEFPNSQHIQNQDISPNGVVTRYASAIATVASLPESKKIPPTNIDEIQRHNQLQQNLSQRIKENKSPQEIQKSQDIYRNSKIYENNYQIENPSFLYGNKATLRHNSDTDTRRTQEKITMFEEINQPPVKRHFRPLNVPRTDLNPPKINIVNPSKVIQPKFKNERSPILSSVSPIDSSDEYLMSCANKPSRNIVLTKSESWHQLALSKNTLQVPQQSISILKPPKPKSPSSLKLTKQYEASSSSDNIKKMEEKIQRYFHGNITSNEGKKEKKKTMRKNSNALMRSHTMPHIYDDKIFDESTDVEKAFDSLFKETTCTDNRY
ncbi:uncharacterized protein LOC127287384 isoform X2 [Leptopilina boulardi]|uniref:uncharacterized protein LOC127287384 isoform X2 n=1 Tax=Leptopilina boulardi TaxID=63433 RepID=UPI0021F59B7F|nr:uncharacterized protein LOC127287384 isoform X2 [Leptopilina boulardi]